MALTTRANPTPLDLHENRQAHQALGQMFIEMDSRVETLSGGKGSITEAYVTIGNSGILTNERALAVGAGLSLLDGGGNGSATLSIPNGGLTLAMFPASADGGELIISNGLGGWQNSGLATAGHYFGGTGTENSFHTISATELFSLNGPRLFGRASAGSGLADEITLGTGLTMVGTTLNASGLGDHNHTGVGDGGVLTNDDHDGFVNVQSISVPANPTANAMRVYTRLNGANIELISVGPLGGECVLCAKPNVAVAEELQLNWVE